MTDPYDLARFVAAQDPIWPRPLAELRQGRKQGHWMWFVFPQIAGLGRSATAQFYAIRGADEARAYRAHDVLGRRLIEATDAVLAAPATLGAEAIMGPIDAIKLRSSLTLFAAVAEDATPFDTALNRFFAGMRDGETLRRL